MVKQVSQVMTLSNSGLSDWVVQRSTAVILTAYFSWVMAFFLFTPNIDFVVLTAFFGSAAMKIAGTLAVLSTVAHAWIGMWTIFTDYIKCKYLLVTLQILAVLGYFICFIWLICILF